jgi:hypothetical protein
VRRDGSRHESRAGWSTKCDGCRNTTRLRGGVARFLPVCLLVKICLARVNISGRIALCAAKRPCWGWATLACRCVMQCRRVRAGRPLAHGTRRHTGSSWCRRSVDGMRCCWLARPSARVVMLIHTGLARCAQFRRLPVSCCTRDAAAPRATRCRAYHRTRGKPARPGPLRVAPGWARHSSHSSSLGRPQQRQATWSVTSTSTCSRCAVARAGVHTGCPARIVAAGASGLPEAARVFELCGMKHAAVAQQPARSAPLACISTPRRLSLSLAPTRRCSRAPSAARTTGAAAPMRTPRRRRAAATRASTRTHPRPAPRACRA